MKKGINWLFLAPMDGPKTIFLLRLMAGSVFFWEGILKFVYTNQGVGRFTKLGMPFPSELATFVALLEILGGLALVLGIYSRFFSLVFVMEMVVAIVTTKFALLNGTSPLAPPPVPPQVGIWAFLHEVRTDYGLLTTCLFVVLEGPGRFSLDAHSRKSNYRMEI